MGVRRLLRRLDRTPWARRLGPLGVALLASALVGVVVALTPLRAEPLAWVGAALPLGIELLRQARSAWAGPRAERARGTTAERYRDDREGPELPTGSLRGRDLAAAKLVRADLANADLTGATLDDARLRRADLAGAVLVDTHCQGANFFQARLPEANLDGAQASGASFEGADLRHASLVEADLVGADFTGADVRGANFAGALLDADALDDATLDAGTVLPDGRSAFPSRWPSSDAWRASMVRASRLGLWNLVRPAAVGLAGAAVATGGAVVSAESFEVAFLEQARGDRVAESRSARPDLFPPVPGGGSSTTRPTPASSTAAADVGSSPDAGPSLDDELDLVEVSIPEPVGAALVGADPADDAATDRVVESMDDTGSDDAQSDPTGDLNAVEAAPLEVTVGSDAFQLGQPRLVVAVESEGGPAEVSVRSALGRIDLDIDGADRLDLGAIDGGVVGVEVRPIDPSTVVVCAISVAGTEQALRRGFPGESITCLLDLDRQG